MLNYDLHWNPVRLIQRFGRIDRIGTEHEVINLHNMWPDVAVDAELSLTERLHRRIQSFHDCRPSAIMGHVRGVENPRV